MSARQKLQVVIVATLAVAVQTVALDTFMLFGLAHLLLPLWLVVAVAGRLPPTNAAVAGFTVGLIWDLLSVDLFGRFAIALAVIGFGASIFTERNKIRPLAGRTVRRGLLIGASTLSLWGISALVGEVMPPLSIRTVLGLLIAVVVGLPFARPGSLLDRLSVPGLTEWEEPLARSNDWVDRRAGLYSVAASGVEAEREAA